MQSARKAPIIEIVLLIPFIFPRSRRCNMRRNLRLCQKKIPETENPAADSANRNAAAEAAAFPVESHHSLEVNASAQLKLSGRVDKVAVGAVEHTKSGSIEG